MRNLKRLLTICVVAVMVMSVFALGAFAADTKFTDVNPSDEALYEAVTRLEGLGIVKGKSSTLFGTNEAVTREQMAAFVYRLMKAGNSLEGGENTTTFEDIYDDTYFSMISWASNMGIIKGVSATQFNPEGGITLKDAYTMLVRALGYENKEMLSYPHDHIQIAEGDKVNLSKNLPAKINYETTLTRGNIAILLYNAFFAQTAEPKTIQQERLIGEGANARYIIESVEKYPRLCEEVYEIVEGNFKVVETTHYAFNQSKTSNEYKPTEDSAGEGTMLLVASDTNQELDFFYATASELKLPEDADSYIMSEMLVYYKLDKDNKIEEILYAEPLMEKITSNSISYGSVEGNRKSNDTETYYATGAISPRMDGSMTVEGNTLYFYDAPYTYNKPSYVGCNNETERYAARNADNTKLIDLICTDLKKGLYSYYITDDVFASKDGYNTEYNSNFAKKFTQVRSSGVYKVDIFDPDGDGRFEYMWYKPASVARIDTDEDHKFSDYKGIVKVDNDAKNENDLAKVAVLYSNGANLSGVAFNDKDFVIAYVNGEANMIDIISVAQGKKGTVRAFNPPNGGVTIGGEILRTCYPHTCFKDFYAYDIEDSYATSSGTANTNIYPFFNMAACLGTEIIYYTYLGVNNHLLYYEIVEETSDYVGGNVLIPIATETVSERDTKTFEYVHYLKVLIGGEEKYVPVDVEKCYPAPKATGSKTYLFDNTVTAENGRKYDVYLNKLCTYEVDADGNYIIHSLLHGQDKKGKDLHVDLVFEKNVFLNEKKTHQAGNDLGIIGADEPVLLKKLSGRYQILDAYNTGYSMLGTYGDSEGTDFWFTDANVDENTVFMIRTITDKDGDGVYENKLQTYTGLSFPGTTTSPLSNVQYVYENSGASKKHANLVLFYGETYDELEFEKTVSAGYKLVKDVTPTKVDDKKFCFSYDLFDLETGTVIDGVLGTIEKTTAAGLETEQPIAVGSIIEVAGGKVDEEETPVLVLNTATNEMLVKLVDIVVSDRTIEIETIREADQGEFSDSVSGNFYNLYEVADDVTITVLKMKEAGKLETAEISAITFETLAEADKALKCYNTKYVDPEDEDNKITTKYAEYVKAFITYEKKDKKELPTIESIVVIVNPDEATTLLDI